ATRRARSLRSSVEYSCVSKRKIGLPPIGLTMGNRAVTISKMLLATSKNISCEEYTRISPGQFVSARRSYVEASNKLCCSDCLADVALCVVGYVDEQAAQSCWQFPASDDAGCFKVG